MRSAEDAAYRRQNGEDPAVDAFMLKWDRVPCGFDLTEIFTRMIADAKSAGAGDDIESRVNARIAARNEARTDRGSR